LRAVFLSYASEDVAAAQRIADALSAAGIEVWFDRSELRGGEAWDRQIRRQIHECALFIALISTHSDARNEGYFRREWKLAVERTADMAEDVPFLLPVVIDATKDATARVPDRFREVQWSHLPEGAPSAAFVERVRRLLSPESASTVHPGAAPRSLSTPKQSAGVRSRVWIVVAAVVAAVAVGYFAFERLAPKPAAPSAVGTESAPATVAASFNPPPHSIAVLPFINLSGDQEQEYFSDGLTEELLNSLAEIDELQVAARTSAFSFKGKDNDIGVIGRKLNVATVLEGSVRRSANTVRVTAQLINTVTGFHLWSRTYNRDLDDALKLQSEIATAVAAALKVTLLGDIAEKIQLGGTSNPAAFDAYLRGLRSAKAFSTARVLRDLESANSAYTEAIHLDPSYALAYAARSTAQTIYSSESATVASNREHVDKALADARRSIQLAPKLAEGHLALGMASELGALAFTQASEAYNQALALAPGNAQVLGVTGRFAVWMGHAEANFATVRRAVVLDPLNPRSHYALGQALYFARRYDEAIAALSAAISVEAEYRPAHGFRGLAYFALGNLESARSSCEATPDYWVSQWCLAVTYDKLGRHADAEAAVTKLKAVNGDPSAYQYATIYTQWRSTAKALEWLETAMRLRDSGLVFLKTDPLMDPLRKETRFQAIERELKFPD
jgi:TolB-like protein/Flp pilus assembly protein TadD